MFLVFKNINLSIIFIPFTMFFKRNSASKLQETVGLKICFDYFMEKY